MSSLLNTVVEIFEGTKASGVRLVIPSKTVKDDDDADAARLRAGDSDDGEW